MQDDHGVSQDSVEGLGTIQSPLPGKVTKLEVRVGDTVKEGQSLIVLESMKMEHLIKSSVVGKIESIRIREGDFVKASDILIKITGL